MFVGRIRELGRLQRHLDRVRDSGQGTFVGVRGRRQVGKSTLLEEFITRTRTPSLFFTASRGAGPDRELAEFARLAMESATEFGALFRSATPRDWAGALRLLAQGVTEPTIVVLDELPWLATGDPAVESALQTAWDRYLSRTPVLLVALGSDVSMMEQLGEYGRPLHQRMRELLLEPLNVRETGELLDLDPAQAFDAQLVAGGFPRILQDWPQGRSAMDFVTEQLADSTSPLVVIGERVLNAEFPTSTQARDVLTAIGAGETTFGHIGSRTGTNQGSLSRTLAALTDLRVVTVDRPLSGAASRLTSYTVADNYLRFWLRFVAPRMELILRGRGELVAAEISRSWSGYRGRAVEPLVRRSIERLLPDERLGASLHVGSYWTRTGEVEVDLVGSPSPEAPAAVSFVGSVKWREQAPFARPDLLALAAQRAKVPGADDAPLVGVARTVVTADVDLAYTAQHLLAAWP